MNPTDKFARIAALKPVRPLPLRSSSLRAPEAEDSLSRLLGAGIAANQFGEHVCIRNWYSTPEFVEPALITVDLLSRARDKALSKRTQTALSDPSKWLFLDTETTGISGGTGTYAFLIGLAWWDGAGLQVEQFIMRDFAEEHSILHELAARLSERPVLVTFNGKTFDWPLLENRFTMTRAIRVPRIAVHLDLLHPARALWKFRLGTVRLVDLEREVLDPRRLGWTRKDDVPTSAIPQLYFDYLRGGPPGPLAGVVRHNQMDLRGLAALFGKINDLLTASESVAPDTDSLDLFGLSRFFQRRCEPTRAFAACSEAVRLGLPPDVRSHARRDLAILAKRRRDHQRAAELWHDLLANDSASIEACIELAIHYERRAKDYSHALRFAHLALVKARRVNSAGVTPAESARNLRLQQALRRRIDRLDRRMNRNPRLALSLRSPSEMDEVILS
jgi:uncharacterized protein